ncbi:hypothetical protein BSL78_29534 [Paramuricea clavata]|uniref:Uncharacterized protein n=1 Tax=Paramuricea clavata TaxID=317549 RepID=A0A6S7HN63_PARCT|nr:hypothetical protein BSL78_29534 [Paramuricea clavata]
MSQILPRLVQQTMQVLRERYVFSKANGTVEMTGPILSDIFMSKRSLLSYVDLKVILNRSSDEFCLMASEDGADYRVKLTDAYLKIRKVKVNPSISVAHEIALKKEPTIYPIPRVECKNFIVSAGNPSLRKDNLFNGLVPKTFVFGLVQSKVFNGALKRNPYNFQHFSVSSIGITINGEEMPFKPLQLSYGAAPKYIEAFSTLFSGTGRMYCRTGNDISREGFLDSYGHAPEYYRKSFGDLLKSHAWDFNRRKLQSALSNLEYKLSEVYFMFKEFIECSSDGKVKWLGNLNDLKAFMSALFGDVGKWSSPGGGAKSYRNDLISINWYIHKKALIFHDQLGIVLKNKLIDLSVNKISDPDKYNQLNDPEGDKDCMVCSRFSLDVMEIKSDLKQMSTLMKHFYRESTPAKRCSTDHLSSVNTCEVGIQTDIEFTQYPNQSGERCASRCNGLSTEFEGLKLDLVISESKIDNKIRINVDAINQVQAEFAIIQKSARRSCSTGRTLS